MNYAREKGYGEFQIISDVSSGLNEERGPPEALRYGFREEGFKSYRWLWGWAYEVWFETLRRLFSAFGTGIEVINHEEKTPREEPVEDLIRIVSHFAGKLYGMRSATERFSAWITNFRRINRETSINMPSTHTNSMHNNIHGVQCITMKK